MGKVVQRIPSGHCVNPERAVGSSILQILHYLFERSSAKVQNDTFKPFSVYQKLLDPPKSPLRRGINKSLKSQPETFKTTS
jgi:hypothetical protein